MSPSSATRMSAAGLVRAADSMVLVGRSFYAHWVQPPLLLRPSQVALCPRESGSSFSASCAAWYRLVPHFIPA